MTQCAHLTSGGEDGPGNDRFGERPDCYSRSFPRLSSFSLSSHPRAQTYKRPAESPLTKRQSDPESPLQIRTSRPPETQQPPRQHEHTVTMKLHYIGVRISGPLATMRPVPPALTVVSMSRSSGTRARPPKTLTSWCLRRISAPTPASRETTTQYAHHSTMARGSSTDFGEEFMTVFAKTVAERTAPGSKSSLSFVWIVRTALIACRTTGRRTARYVNLLCARAIFPSIRNPTTRKLRCECVRKPQVQVKVDTSRVRPFRIRPPRHQQCPQGTHVQAHIRVQQAARTDKKSA